MPFFQCLHVLHVRHRQLSELWTWRFRRRFVFVWLRWPILISQILRPIVVSFVLVFVCPILVCPWFWHHCLICFVCAIVRHRPRPFVLLYHLLQVRLACRPVSFAPAAAFLFLAPSYFVLARLLQQQTLCSLPRCAVFLIRCLVLNVLVLVEAVAVF